MLRRKPDGLYEFLLVEEVLRAGRPQPLAPGRKEAVRLLIMARLEAQDPEPAPLAFLRQRWVAVPAGVGLAAAILASIQWAATANSGAGPVPYATAEGELVVGGVVSKSVAPGQRVYARTAGWVSIEDDVRIGLEPGSSMEFYYERKNRVRLEYGGGNMVVATEGREVLVRAAGVSALLGDGVLSLSLGSEGLWLRAVEGTVTVEVDGQSRVLVAPGWLLVPFTPVAGGPSPGAAPGAPSQSPGAGGSGHGVGAPQGGAQDTSEAATPATPGTALPGAPWTNTGTSAAPPAAPGGSELATAPGRSEPPPANAGNNGIGSTGTSGIAPGQVGLIPGAGGSPPAPGLPAATPGNGANAPGQAKKDEPPPQPADSAPGNSANAPGQAKKDEPPPQPADSAPGNSANAPGQAKKDEPPPQPAASAPGNSANAPGQAKKDEPPPPPQPAASAPGNSANAPGQAKKDEPPPPPPADSAPGNSANAPGQAKKDQPPPADSAPGNSANAPGQAKKK